MSAQNSLVGGATSSGLGTTTFDTVNSSFVGAFTADTSNSSNGRVRIGIYDPNEMTFERAQGQDMTVLPEFLTGFLNAGTAVEIQANNDVTIDAAITSSNPGGDGGDLTLTAGRSIEINADITTDNGSFTATANDPGAVSAERDAGDASITIGAGVVIDTGTGDLTLEIEGVTDASGITLGVGSTLTATTGDILLISAVDITAPGAATISTTGGGDITLVVDNAFPTAPGIGPGLFDMADMTITGGGLVRLYAGDFGISTFPASINGTAYDPASGFNQTGNTYYPGGSGGTPFHVFYKSDAPQPPSPPSPSGPTDEERNRGKFKYFVAMSEAFTRWTPYSFGGIEGFRIYAPMGTGLMYFWMPHYMMEGIQREPIKFEFIKERERSST